MEFLEVPQQSFQLPLQPLKGSTLWGENEQMDPKAVGQVSITMLLLVLSAGASVRR